MFGYRPRPVLFSRLKSLSLVALVMCLAALMTPQAIADAGRGVKDLSEGPWHIWRDKEAKWEDDTLHLPPVDVSQLEAQPPTCGWDKLDSKREATTDLPATVEEYLWGKDGSPQGTRGNYSGVSWWWHDFQLPADWAGRRLRLCIDSVNMRAEVFVNEKLVGYDCIGQTPFEVDITDAIKLGKNRLAIRITDPFGNNVFSNFAWQDYQARGWGKQMIVPAHGFGGITGDVRIEATDAVWVEDMFILNKPSPSVETPSDIDLDITLRNDAEAAQSRRVQIDILDDAGQSIYAATEDVEVEPGEKVIRKAISLPDAKIWDLGQPALYRCRVSLHDGEAASPGDDLEATFGLRWFEAIQGEGIDDARLELNGRKIFTLTAISWGFFPVNGMYPTQELTERQIQAAQDLGLNMLSAHRAIVHPRLLKAADEAGILYHCEPGGFQCFRGDDFSDAQARIKYLRMVRRDRNHPSLVIRNAVNEPYHRKDVKPHLKVLAEAFDIDPSRIMTYSSGASVRHKDAMAWYNAYDEAMRMSGWFDEHWVASTYAQDIYRGPQNFSGYATLHEKRDWIVYCGEENADSAPPLLGSLVEDYKRWGRAGWDGQDYFRKLQQVETFLDESGARKDFPTADDFCRTIGNIPLEHHAEVIENLRMDDLADGYVINGWECEKMENWSGIVGPGRRPKGNPDIVRQAMEPFRVVVKLRRRIAPTEGTLTADIWLMNADHQSGSGRLEIQAIDAAGKALETVSREVDVQGGAKTGQLLAEGIELPAGTAIGYGRIEARLLRDGEAWSQDQQQSYVVDPDVKLPEDLAGKGAVWDDTGMLKAAVAKHYDSDVEDFQPGGAYAYILVGEADSEDKAKLQALVEGAKDGASVVFMTAQFDAWLKRLKDADIWDNGGHVEAKRKFTGGNYVAMRHPFFTDLPQAEGMGWVFQVFLRDRQKYDKKSPYRDWHRYGAKFDKGTVAAACWSGYADEISAGLIEKSLGRGRLVWCTFRLPEVLDEDAPASLVARRLLYNMLCHTALGENP